MAFSNNIKLECIQCEDVTEDNWTDQDDDLLVCTNANCKSFDKIICRTCMKAVHKKKGNHSSDYMDAAAWWKQQLQLDSTAKLEMIKNNTPDFANKNKGVTKGVVAVGNALIIGAKNGGYAVYSEQTLKGLQALKNPTTKQLQKRLAEILTNLGKSSEETTKIIAKAATNGGDDGMRGLWNSLKQYSSEASKGVVCVKDVATGQAIVNFTFCVLEMGYNAVEYYYYRSISEDEYLRRNNKAIVANVATFGGGTIGGALVGAVFGPVGVVVGSVIGSYVADYYSRNWFDDKWPDKSEQFIEAMKTFNFDFRSLDQVLKSDAFNMKVIRKRYHELSKYHNPNGGFMSGSTMSQKEKEEDWNNFYEKYCLLLTIAKQKEEKGK